jgi:hypothetical protein
MKSDVIKTNNHNPPTSQDLYSPPASRPPKSLARRKITAMRILVPTIALLALSLTLFALILAYSLDYTKSTFNRFFSSNQFGPRFILSLLATVLSHVFQRLERTIRIYTPWRTSQSLVHSSSVTSDQSRDGGNDPSGPAGDQAPQPPLNPISSSSPLSAKMLTII